MCGDQETRSTFSLPLTPRLPDAISDHRLVKGVRTSSKLVCILQDRSDLTQGAQTQGAQTGAFGHEDMMASLSIGPTRVLHRKIE